VPLETKSSDDLEPTGETETEAEAGTEAEAATGGDTRADALDPGAAADDAPEAASGAEASATSVTEVVLTELSATVREVADLSQRYHARAEQREGVIDLLRSELEVLRRGERRGLLRPLLTDLCRLRGDLLSQAGGLPADFDAAKAADLLCSYAETIEQTLESNGVVTYAPGSQDRFDPRMHRRVGGEPTGDPGQAGHIAAVRRDGYLDIESNSPLAPAEVTVFALAKVTEGEQ